MNIRVYATIRHQTKTVEFKFPFSTYTAENEAEPSHFPVAQDGTVPQVHISSAIGCRLFSSKARAEQKQLGNVITLRLS